MNDDGVGTGGIHIIGDGETAADGDGETAADADGLLAAAEKLARRDLEDGHLARCTCSLPNSLVMEERMQAPNSEGMAPGRATAGGVHRADLAGGSGARRPPLCAIRRVVDEALA